MVATETDRLFEHILLEFLALEKNKMGETRSYEGVTSWDWNKDEFGTFHIRINAGMAEKERFLEALKKTSKVFSRISG